MEPSWPKWPGKTLGQALLDPGSGLDFGGPGLDFGGPETRFGTVLARFFRDSWPECRESQERPERLPKQDRDHKSAKSGWAAVLPPRGVSIK